VPAIRTPINKNSRMIVNSLSIKEFSNRKNRLLIVRGSGGLGDILMHRMIFEDIKLLLPDAHITFAIPSAYFSAVEDHPFIDSIVDCNTVNVKDFLISYNTTTACGRYENRIAPAADKHRSDIWAEHCGIKLTRHNMHIHLTDAEIDYGRTLIKRFNKDGKKVIIFSPISAMQSKNLDITQVNGVISELEKMGYCVLLLHGNPLTANAPTLTGVNVRQWMGIINAADYVISVDTSTFHFAGGIGKPVIGVFTFANAATYGKYYPSAELIQGPCPFKHAGCFTWHKCPQPHHNNGIDLPCRSNITVSIIVSAFLKLYNS
jgi:ADP-heptose:LPS heptosyltransferase